MNQVKIGKFIAECRKNKGLTQAQLAEMFGITDRAVSKWETGKAMPDSSIMLELCRVLEINVNELLLGERIDMNEKDNKTEELLLEMTKAKEERDKRLLRMEIVMGIVCLIPLFTLTIIAGLANMEDRARVAIIITGIAPLLILTPFAIAIEQKAGYYECRHCHHKYVPKYKQVFFAMHYNRTRYMKCPECQKRSWQKKVISKD